MKKEKDKIPEIKPIEPEKKSNTALYLLAVVGLILFLIFLAYLITKGVVSLAIALFVFIIIVAIIILIVLFKYVWKRRKEEPETDIFKTDLKVNSNTMVDWARNYMLKNFLTEFEIIEKRVVQVGEYSKRTPIGILKVTATTTNKRYNIFVNFFEPDKFNTIVSGIMDSKEMLSCINGLAYAPYYQPKRIVRKQLSDGTTMETEEDLFKENVKEVVTPT